MIDIIPAQVTVSGSVAAAVIASQVVQLGFEATLLRNQARLEARMNYGTDK